jgi:copper resistance protein B
MIRPLNVLLVFLSVSIGVTPAIAQPAEHKHDPPKAQAPTTPPTGDANDHAQHQQTRGELPPFIPPITEEDRRAAFPQDVEGHAVHDRAINSYLLFDQFEWQSNAGGTGLNIDTKGWLGTDRDRLWFRAEGDGEDGRVGEAEAHVLYGRQFSRWWDVVAGVRHEFTPGPSRTWAAFGIQGLAPYWFEVELTGYVGESGRTQLRGEVEYELLLTNRLVLQPLVEIELVGQSDPERGVGAGLSATDAGFRVRYEFRREVAPYIGVMWGNKWGQTADFATAAGESTGGSRLVLGMRLWF